MSFDTAIRNSDLAEIHRALRSGEDVDQITPVGLTPLMVASAYGNAQVVALLLTAGATPLAVDPKMGSTALHKGAQSGNADVLTLLLDHGAFIDQQSPSLGNTALMDAVLHKQQEAVELLLGRGARTDVTNHWHQTALDLAQEDGLGAIVDLIGGRDAAYARRVATFSLLAAAKAGDHELVDQLIANGAALNERSPISGTFDDDYTPLGIAARGGHVQVVQALLEAGADPRRTVGIMKGTAVHDAAFFGYADVLRSLLAAYPLAPTADIDAQGPYNGLTALHDAVWHGHADAARVLVQAGASLDLRTHGGLTPKDLAALYGYSELVEMLDAEESRRSTLNQGGAIGSA